MARYSKKKVIKKKSVNKNKNKNTRVKKRRVSWGKSRRRVKRKYRGGGEYIELKDKKDKIIYYEYAKKLAELIYTVLHIIFILSENINKAAVLKSLMKGYKVTDSTKIKKITAFLNELLDIVFKYYKKKTGGGNLNFKTGSREYTVTRPTASGLTELGFLQEFGIVMAKADADELNYFFETKMSDESVKEILSDSVSNRLREITSTTPPDVIPTFSTFLKNPATLPAGDAGDAGVLAGHILLATKAAIDTVEYNVTNQPDINFDLVLNIENDIDTFLTKMEIINASARAEFQRLVSTL